MKKRLKNEELTATEGPMNSVALDDAAAYLGINDQDELTIDQARQLRAKKRKIVTSSKKMERRVSREVTRQVDRLE
jgi:hypothetical protein|tara:strand:- start:76 stop:303 length:228 start_codon:yes stop_codon:yes gene_type:complete